MRLRLLAVLIAVAAANAAQPKIQEPIPEIKLTNGTVFRNVTIVRYESTTVVLKSSAGTAPLSYTMIPEPLRTQMIAERDRALAAKKRIEEAINSKSLVVGMTREEAVRAWGQPQKKNTSGGTYGATEQWVYGATYVYFRDGLLTSWQQSR